MLLGRSKLEITVRYLGIEVDDALEIAEQTDVQSPSVDDDWALPRPRAGLESMDDCFVAARATPAGTAWGRVLPTNVNR